MSDKLRGRSEVGEEEDDVAALEARAKERAQRQAEIEAIKREMLSTKPANSVPPKQEAATRQAEESSTSSSSSSSSDNSDSSDSEDSDEEGDARHRQREWTSERFPFHFPLVLRGEHTKAVTAVAVDKHGTRMVTGSIDGTVLVWDLSKGLSRDLRPMRTLATTSSLTGGATDQAVTRVAFDSKSALFAVARSDPQIRVYTREGTNGAGGSGEAKVTTTRGDNYIRDMSQTKGHVGAVSDLRWSTIKPEILFTSGLFDGTVRIWDIEHGPKALMGLELACSHILKTPAKPGARASLQAMTRSADSKRILAGSGGATLYLWDIRAGGVFSSMPDKSFICTSSAAEFVSLAIDDSNTYCGIAQKDAYEVRDMRKLDKTLWSKTKVGFVVKEVDFYRDLLVAGASTCISIHSASNGTQLATESEPGLSSNVIWTDDRMVHGRSDGSVVFSFEEATGRDFVESVPSRAELFPAKQRSNDVDAFSFARIDQSKVESQGAIMPAHEARKLMKGTKRAKTDLDDLGDS